MEIGEKFRTVINLLAKAIGADSTLEYMRLLSEMKPEDARYFAM